MDLLSIAIAKALAGGGGGGGGGETKIYRGTTAHWNAQTDRSELNALYIYTDFDTDDQGGLIPALKIGDGVNTVAALKFISAGSAALITEQDVDKWNTNVSVDKSELADGILSLI